MKTQRIDGVTVLAPQTPDQLREAVNSGRPFLAPDQLAEDFGLPQDEDPDIDLLADPEDDVGGV